MIQKILRFISPLIKCIGKLHWPFTHKKVTGKDYYLVRDKIKQGCIILTYTRGEISNLINKGEFKHASLYAGGEKIKHVIHATGEGVNETDLVSFLLKTDFFVVLKSKKLSEEQLEIAISVAYEFIGEQYDYIFDFENEEKYCSELLYASFNIAAPELQLRHQEVAGKKIVKPDDFLKDTENWKVVYDSRVGQLYERSN